MVAASEESVFTAGGVEICGPGGVAPGKSTEKPRGGTRESEERPIREESEEEESESGPDDVSYFYTLGQNIILYE